MPSFEELRKNIFDIEKNARRVEFQPPSEETGKYAIDIKMLSYDLLLNELDKLYKIKQAKEYLIRKR